MNEPAERIRPLPNVFKGSGGLDKAPMEQLRKGRGPLHKALEDLDRAGIVRGHVPYGLRDYLPQYVPRGRKVRWLTFLREPVDRSLSHYFGVCATRRPAPGVKVPWSRLPAEPTMDELIEGGYIHDNLHTRMLCGLPEPFDEVSDEMLEEAKRNLREGLHLFGITERFDESLVLARRRLGLGSILHQRRARANPSRPRGDDVPAELVAAAERWNRHDLELYRFACGLFEEAPELRELEFRVEVAAVRAARGKGEIADDVAAPEGFAGGKEEWRMLLRAKAALLRSERPHALDDELRATRARAKELEGEVKRLKRAARRQAAGGGRPAG